MQLISVLGCFMFLLLYLCYFFESQLLLEEGKKLSLMLMQNNKIIKQTAIFVISLQQIKVQFRLATL